MWDEKLLTGLSFFFQSTHLWVWLLLFQWKCQTIPCNHFFSGFTGRKSCVLNRHCSRCMAYVWRAYIHTHIHTVNKKPAYFNLHWMFCTKPCIYIYIYSLYLHRGFLGFPFILVAPLSTLFLSRDIEAVPDRVCRKCLNYLWIVFFHRSSILSN